MLDTRKTFIFFRRDPHCKNTCTSQQLFSAVHFSPHIPDTPRYSLLSTAATIAIRVNRASPRYYRNSKLLSRARFFN